MNTSEPRPPIDMARVYLDVDTIVKILIDQYQQIDNTYTQKIRSNYRMTLYSIVGMLTVEARERILYNNLLDATKIGHFARDKIMFSMLDNLEKHVILDRVDELQRAPDDWDNILIDAYCNVLKTKHYKYSQDIHRHRPDAIYSWPRWNNLTKYETVKLIKPNLIRAPSSECLYDNDRYRYTSDSSMYNDCS
jgi:hypothetical protein